MSWISRIFHTLFYLSCLFLLFFVLKMPISIIDKGIYVFTWFYIIVVYSYFVDQNSKIFNIKSWLDKKDEENEFLEELLNISLDSFSLMRRIQLHKDKNIVNESIQELYKRNYQLKQLTPPTKYKEKYQEILLDVDMFLEEIKEGNHQFNFS